MSRLKPVCGSVRTSFARTEAALKAYIIKHVELNYVRSDGSTLKQHLAKLKKQVAEKKLPPATLEKFQAHIEASSEPPINSYEQWLLGRFWELDASRHTGQYGPQLLTYADIAAYAEAMRIELEPAEVHILKSVDCAFVNAMANEQAKHSRE